MKKQIDIEFDDKLKDELNELIKNYSEPHPMIYDELISEEKCFFNKDAFIRNKEKIDEMNRTIEKAIAYIQNSYSIEGVLEGKELLSIRIDQYSWNLLSKAMELYSKFTTGIHSQTTV